MWTSIAMSKMRRSDFNKWLRLHIIFPVYISPTWCLVMKTISRVTNVLVRQTQAVGWTKEQSDLKHPQGGCRIRKGCQFLSFQHIVHTLILRDGGRARNWEESMWFLPSAAMGSAVGTVDGWFIVDKQGNPVTQWPCCLALFNYVWDFCCCVIKDHKLRGLNQHPFLSTEFRRSEVQYGRTGSSRKGQVKMLGVLCFFLEALRQSSASQFLPAVARIQFLTVVELRFSFPYWLSAWTHSWLLNANHTPLPGGTKSFLRTRSGQTGIIYLNANLFGTLITVAKSFQSNI